MELLRGLAHPEEMFNLLKYKVGGFTAVSGISNSVSTTDSNSEYH
uniref:Uncharacterized protein n=1 Tax=Callorhinchus milii TaxID=7868 RepID=A0A4W3HHZ2_CALMI